MYIMYTAFYVTGFADNFSVNPMSLTVHITALRFAFECQIDTFARNENDFNRMRIEWEGAFSNMSEVFHTQDSENTFNPLPGYSILVVDTNDSFMDRDMFPDRYRCRAVFISQDGMEVTVATSDLGFLIIDDEGTSIRANT